jgi:hypothetical protein
MTKDELLLRYRLLSSRIAAFFSSEIKLHLGNQVFCS